MTATLTLEEFLAHLAECGLVVREVEGAGPWEVVIRGETGDHALAAVHVEGARLVLDIGRKLDE